MKWLFFSMFAGIFQGQKNCSNQTFPSTPFAQSHSNSKEQSNQRPSFNCSFAPAASGSNTSSSMSFMRMLNEDYY